MYFQNMGLNHFSKQNVGLTSFGDYYICKIEPFEYKYVIKYSIYTCPFTNIIDTGDNVKDFSHNFSLFDRHLQIEV